MELYHCLNRGVDKRKIVVDQQDRARFVHELYTMNDNLPAGNSGHYLHMDLRSPYVRKRDRERRPRETLVNIHGWCLMDNHYHLLVSEKVEGGLTKFLRKLNIGYAKYFNEKHKREGTLFEGRTKKILIEREAHFNHILHYIHANPLDYLKSTRDWRNGTIPSTHNALEHLNSYKWSSYLDYTNQENYSLVLSMSLFNSVFPDYKDFFTQFLKARENAELANLWLE